MKKIIIIFSLPILCLLTSCESVKSFSWQEEPNYKKEIHGLDKNTMPIAGFSGPTYSGRGSSNSNPYTLSDEDVRQQWVLAKEAGFNIMYPLYWAERIYDETQSDYESHHEHIMKNLRYASENDMKYVVYDNTYVNYALSDSETAKEDYLSYLDKAGYLKEESFIGLLGRDEPYYEDFADLYKYNKFINEALPNYLFYLNMHPCYVSPSLIHYKGYDEFIADYLNEVKPDYLSYDYYAPLGEFPNMRDTYFYQLGLIRNVVQEQHLPFWCFVLTSKHYDYRLIKPSELYWQVNTSLAYGAKGIQYFNFKTPIEADYIDQGGSVIDADGNKTILFEPTKRINNYIAEIDDILMDSSHQLTIARGDKASYFYFGEEDNKSFRELQDISVSQGGVVIGCFDYHGNTVLFVSSNDIQNNTKATLKFKAKINGQCFGMNESHAFSSKRLSLDIAPGEAYLVQIF